MNNLDTYEIRQSLGEYFLVAVERDAFEFLTALCTKYNYIQNLVNQQVIATCDDPSRAVNPRPLRTLTASTITPRTARASRLPSAPRTAHAARPSSAPHTARAPRQATGAPHTTRPAPRVPSYNGGGRYALPPLRRRAGV